MWQNKYVGIPYRDNGRDLDGMDCWGLARYVYNKEFNITLPSFSEDYDGNDSLRIQELIAQYKEGWESVEEPKSGDLVLLRVLGTQSHVGIITEYPYFLHAREGHESSIERLDSSMWEKRVVGIFRYTETARNNLVAIPSALKSTRITDIIPEGFTLQQVHEQLVKTHGIVTSDKDKTVIIVNGRVIPEAEWDYVVKEGDSIEYRAVPGKDVLRIVAVVALVYFTGGIMAGTGLGGAFATSLGISGGFAATALSMGIMAAGMALINAIMPIRPPAGPTDPGSAKAQNLINAVSNTATPYEPIPVVLGKVRMTPPVGANNYVEPMTTDSYVRMLLVWGYGPLTIEDMRIGANPISDYEATQQTLYGYGTETATEIAAFNSIYGRDVQQLYKNIKLDGSDNVKFLPDGITTTPDPSPWQELTFTNPASELQVAIHFPQGLRKIKSMGDGAGGIYPATFVGEIQYALAGTNDWYSSLLTYAANSFTLPVASMFSSDEFGVYFLPMYQWHTVYTKRGGGTYIAHGDLTSTKTMDPIINAPFMKSRTGSRLPILTASDIPLYYVCVYANQVTDIVKITDYTHDTVVSATDLSLSVSAGSVTLANSNYINLGGEGQPFCRQKDAFTYTEKIVVPYGTYKIRVRRLDASAPDVSGSEWATLYDAVLYTGTAFNNANPVTDDPASGKFARTALRITATNQLNGSVEGINALVTSVCPDWDVATGTWVTRPTNNPASLLRYVLQHPANAQRIKASELNTKIDLPQLQYWHAFCASKGFTFNSVLNNTRSILDVLRDIAAAGRASPAIVDGKWTVVIDEPKTQVIQHFSTHNSWGFEAVKPLVRIPDAFKVIYNNEKANYIQDELYVYNTGKNSTNATIFEQVQFPGVTSAEASFKHARWHLAQLKLRPETYSLNTDLEYLVCNRGDLVRVQHDVPMWGIGTGRIVAKLNSVTIRIDNEIPLEAGNNYSIRIRLANGTSVTKNLSTITTSGYYSDLVLNSSITDVEASPDNLVLLGVLNQESQQCIVLSVEPIAGGTAKVTLVDYNPAMYNIDTSTDYPIPNFEPNITTFKDVMYPYVSQTPTIVSIISDEQALEVISPGVFRNRIKLNYTETVGQDSLSVATNSVELQWKLSSNSTTAWPNKQIYSISTGSCYAVDVLEGLAYDLRIRYVRYDGIAGDWTTATNHIVVGRMTPPSAVSGASYELLPNSLRIKWLDNPEIDVMYYEVREADSGWGADNNYLFKGGATNIIATPAASGISKTWYIRAIDAANNYSTSSAYISYVTPALPNVTSITANYSSSSLTEATVELRWNTPEVLFGLAYYELSYNGTTKQILSNSIILPANWLGDRSFTLKVVDSLGNISSGYTATITKLAPNPIIGYRAQVIDNNVLLYWSYGAKTSLPIAHVLLKRSPVGGSWETATVVGTKSGEFTSISELSGGEYIYWLAAVDTDARESTPIQLPVTVSQPPDFKFTAEYISQLTGTYTNASSYAGDLFLPVNTSETWQNHFATEAWTSPNDQVVAGYPVFIQPGIASGHYEEVFDYGTILASSQITLNTVETDVVGSTSKVATIYISTDGVTYTSVGNYSAFATNFRYIKVRLDVTQVSPGSICKISDLRVRLDSKQKSEANYVSVPTTGQIVNFEGDFIDIQSIILTPASTTPVLSVYDFKDTVITGTYSVVSGTATINATAHGLIAGQKVRLYFTTGNAVSGMYIIQAVINANSYTVTMASSDTTGSVTTYPNSMIIYSFTPTTGAAVASTTSYQIKGY